MKSQNTINTFVRYIAGIAISTATFIGAVGSASAAKLFISDSSSDTIFRYEVTESNVPTFDLTITDGGAADPFLDAPGSIAFSSEEMFILNRGSFSGGFFDGSIARYLDPTGTPTNNGLITNSSIDGLNLINPHGIDFHNDKLFVGNSKGDSIERFDYNGSTDLPTLLSNVPNVSRIRGVEFNLAGDELFVSRCCDINTLERYKLDSSGNIISSETITGNGLSNPHEIAISPWGEIFVANAGSNSVSRFFIDNGDMVQPNGTIFGAPGMTIGVEFSPWGELFVAGESSPNVRRWVFADPFGAAIANGEFTVEGSSGLLYLEFAPTESIPEPSTILGTLFALGLGVSLKKKRGK